MEQKINITELLKDCPSGMELDCLLCNSPIELENVFSNEATYPIRAVGKDGFHHIFTAYGTSYNHNDAKCVIFPKGKTTWDGFQRPFKDGDIVVAEDDELLQMFILKKVKYHENDSYNGYCYFGWCFDSDKLFHEGIWGFNRLATEEEKEKLFKAIKDNGYKWNPETKTLEKLIKPKFKVGDKIIRKHRIGIDYPTEVIAVENGVYYCKGMSMGIEHQDEWELVPNKFDITTLKPFESRVLMRDKNTEKWVAQFFSHYNNGSDRPYTCIGCEGLNEYIQCIPYEGNEHLLDTTNDCDEYYKTW